MEVRIVAAANAAVNVVVKLVEDGLEGGLVISCGLNCGGFEVVEEVEVVVERRAEGEKVDAIGNKFG